MKFYGKSIPTPAAFCLNHGMQFLSTSTRAFSALLVPMLLAGCATSTHAPDSAFVPLFNGQDLNGWRGGSTFDHRKLLAMPEAEHAKQIAKWTSTLTATNATTGRPHWYAEKRELVNDGCGDYA